MSNEIRVPELGESITEATIAQWYKKPGDTVAVDEPLCELETDKVTIEVPAQSAGVLSEVMVNEGDTVEVGALLGTLGEGSGAAATPAPASPATPSPEAAAPAPEVSTPAPVATPVGAPDTSDLSPAVRRVVEEHGLNPADISGTGKAGRLTKEDAMNAAKGATPASGMYVCVPLCVCVCTRE